MGLKRFSIQLKDSITEQAIITAGGKCLVLQPGTPDKAVIYNPATGATMTNPMTPTRGKIEFDVQDTYNTIDIQVQAPGGQWLGVAGIVPSGPNEILIDTGEKLQHYVIPFSIADTTATTETATGIVIPSNGAVQPCPLLRVTAVDATETIDVGTLSTDSGDADGFLVTASVATLGLVKGSLANGALTLGALLWVQDSANAGDEAPEQNVSMAGKQITYTLTAGTDTAKGFITLQVLLVG